MKRVVSVVSFILLAFLYACGGVNTPIPAGIGTAVAQTQTATMWTPTITSTINPDVSKIVQLINDGFQEDTLEFALDARYVASNALFMYAQDNSRILYLEIDCSCAINSHCCVPERTFVVTIHAMKKQFEGIIEQVPDYTVRVVVECRNSHGAIGVLSAPWADVKAYLRDEIDGLDFGLRVTPVPTP